MTQVIQRKKKLRSDLTGRRFGRLIVLYDSGKRTPGKQIIWHCQCDCGKMHDVRAQSLQMSSTTSCGCYGKARGLTHGMSNTNTYRRWSGMLQRCYNPNNPKYADYGGRGITVCDRWHSFENWYADLGEPPAGKSMDRIDNDGPYSPENVVWADNKRQSQNQRTARLVTFHNETLNVAEWARRTGIDRHCIKRRLNKGWEVERALTTPDTAETRMADDKRNSKRRIQGIAASTPPVKASA